MCMCLCVCVCVCVCMCLCVCFSVRVRGDMHSSLHLTISPPRLSVSITTVQPFLNSVHPHDAAVVCFGGGVTRQAAAMFIHEARRGAWFARKRLLAVLLHGDTAGLTAAAAPKPLDVDAVVTSEVGPNATAAVAAEYPGVPVMDTLSVGVARGAVAAANSVLHDQHATCGGDAWWRDRAVYLSRHVQPPLSFVPFPGRAPGDPVAWTVQGGVPPERRGSCVGWRPYRPSVGVVHYRPHTLAPSTFEGGFVSAMRLVDGPLYDVVWMNIAHNQSGLNFDGVDVLLVKSNWGWGVDTACRATLAATPWSGLPKRVLLISGVAPPPADVAQVLFYDVLVYETKWYLPQVSVGCAVHGVSAARDASPCFLR